MTAYRVRYTPEAAGRIRKLHPEVKQEIRDAIRILRDSPLTGHTLQQELFGYRFTVCGPTALFIDSMTTNGPLTWSS